MAGPVVRVNFFDHLTPVPAARERQKGALDCARHVMCEECDGHKLAGGQAIPGATQE
jgi:hypothetical protein